MPSWRFRRCPNCHQVGAAGDLVWVRSNGDVWKLGGSTRQCRHCGHRAPTQAFDVVRERHQNTPLRLVPGRLEPEPLEADVLAVVEQEHLWTSSTSSGMYGL